MLMSDELKIPSLARDAQATIETKGRSITFSASSSEPVERFFGTEILEHSERAIDMRRISGRAAPLLFNHSWDDPVGMVTGGRLEDGRLVVDADFFDTNRADEVQAMIDGGLRNVSIGYEIHEMREGERGEFTATRWEPVEISVVTVPADMTVGIGRSNDESKPVRVIRANSTTATTPEKTEVRMDEQTAPAAETAEIEIIEEHNPIEFDKRRSDAIVKLAEANHIDNKTTRHWIQSGTDFDQIASDILTIHEERGKSASAPALIGMTQKEVGEYSILRAIGAAKANNWKGAGLEFEAHRALMDRDNLQPHSDQSVYVPMDVQARMPRYGKRDFTAAVAGAAGGVGTDHLSGSFIDLLYNASVTMGSGATRLTGLRGNVQIPKLTAGATSYWLASETTAITESTPTMGKVSLSPKNVAALVEISHQMAQQSDPSAEQMVLNDLAQSVALAMDVGALSGDGTGGAPTGIQNTAGIGAFTGTSLDYAAVLNAQVDVATANAMGVGSLAYVTSPAVAALLMQRVKFASTASPIWDGNILTGDCAGLPGRTSNQMAADEMLFGAWASLIIAEWGTLELAVDDKFNFATGSIGLRAWYTVDVGVRYPGAFSLATSIT